MVVCEHCRGAGLGPCYILGIPKWNQRWLWHQHIQNWGRYGKLFVIKGKLVLALLCAFPPVGNNFENSSHLLWLLIHCRTLLIFLYQHINCCRRNWGKAHACNPFVTRTVTVTKSSKAEMMFILILLNNMKTTFVQVQAVCSSRDLGLCWQLKERTCMAYLQKLYKWELLIGRCCFLKPQAIKKRFNFNGSFSLHFLN